MLSLLTAVTGRRVPDRPDWPLLPRLLLDTGSRAHIGADCAAAAGTLTAMTDTAEDLWRMYAATMCDTCLSPFLTYLDLHRYEDELSDADHALASTLEACAWTPRELDREGLPAGFADLLADPAGRDRARTLLTGNPDGCENILTGIALAQAAADTARPLLTDLPASLVGRWEPRLAATEAALATHARLLRDVLDDVAVTAVANTRLDVAVTGDCWCFYTTGNLRLAEKLALVRMLWPDTVVVDRSGLRMAARLPTAAALAWLGRSGITEIVAAPGTPTPTTGPGQPTVPIWAAAPDDLAAADPATVATALELWTPGTTDTAAPMTMADAFTAALGIHAPAD